MIHREEELAIENHPKATIFKAKNKKVMVGRMLPVRDDEVGPPWLKPLLETHFFTPCRIHGNYTKSECNMYCLDCMGDTLCSYCRSRHKDHHLVQAGGNQSVIMAGGKLLRELQKFNNYD